MLQSETFTRRNGRYRREMSQREEQTATNRSRARASSFKLRDWSLICKALFLPVTQNLVHLQINNDIYSTRSCYATNDVYTNRAASEEELTD